MIRVKIVRVLIVIVLLGVKTYGQSSKVDNSYKTKLGLLIKRASKLQTKIDSLPLVIAEFEALTAKYHDKTSVVYTELYKAQIEWLKSDHFSAMKHAVKCLNDAQTWKEDKPLPIIYALIGNLHKENSSYPMAFQAAQNGLNAARNNRDTSEIIALLGLKAMFKRSFTLHYNKLDYVPQDSSIYMQLEGLKMAESSPKYEKIRIRYYDNIGQYYNDSKMFDLAKYYAQKGVDLATKFNEQRSLTYGYNWLGEAYFRSGDEKTGLVYLERALAISKKIKQPYRTMEIYAAISNCYESAHNYKPAFEYIRKYLYLHDSLRVQDNEKQIGELQIRYETAKKDKNLALLDLAAKEKNRQLLWLLVGGVLFVILSGILFYLYHIIRQKNTKLTSNNKQINIQAEKLQLLMQELHHRVKNNLQIVSSLLTLQSSRIVDKEGREALDVSRQRVEAMSFIHNSLYQYDAFDKVNMNEFLPVLLQNILESFGANEQDMDIKINVEIEDINVDIAMPLGLIMNEWITNIFKHAYKYMKGRPALTISANYRDGNLKVKIKDNGVGMPLESWENPVNSFGIKLIKILIKQIRGVSSVTNVNGTILELDIPYNK